MKRVSREVFITIQKPVAYLHACSDVCVELSGVNARKASGPDGFPGHVLKACAVQLTEAWTNIFNLSPAQAAVPMCFKTTSIMPEPQIVLHCSKPY